MHTHTVKFWTRVPVSFSGDARGSAFRLRILVDGYRSVGRWFSGDLRLRLIPFGSDPQGSARRCSCASSAGSARNGIITPRNSRRHNCENVTAPNEQGETEVNP